jgi:beta-lactamase regulating signal transducer with metallopeptidase domain
MLWWTIQNSLVIAVLALAVMVICRLGRLRPAIEHALWLVLFLKFLLPPVVAWPWVVGDWIPSKRQETSVASSTMQERDFVPLVHRDDLSEPSSDEVADFASKLFITGQGLSEVVPATDTTDVSSSHVAETETVVSRSTNGIVWPSLILAIWLSGVVGVALWQVGRIRRIRRLLRDSRPAPCWLVERVVGLARTIGVRPPPTLVAAGIDSPCLWCFGRPVLVWPEALAHTECQEVWQGVIAHELAHLRRRDHWIAWPELLAGCLWWFNPLFWFVRRRLRASAELACDAWVVATVPGDQRAYAESLVEVTRMAIRPSASARLPAPVLGASMGARRSLERRLTMILSQPRPCRISRLGLIGTCVLALFALPAWSFDPLAVEDVAAPGAGVTVEAPPSVPSEPAKAADPAVAAPMGIPAPARAADADRISKLEQQIDALLKEVQGLRGARSRAPARSPLASSSLRLLAPDGKLIAVIGGDGEVTLFDAATEKVLFQTKLGHSMKARSMAFSPDGKYLAVEGDDKVWHIDAVTGRVLSVAPGSTAASPGPAKSARRDSGDAAAAAPRAGRPARSGAPSVDIAAAPSSHSGVSSLSAPIGGVQLDLVRLATEYSDAIGNVKLAERLLDLAQKSHASGESTQKDAITAEINLINARQKLKLLKTIGEAATLAAKAEVSAAETRHAAGQANESEAAQARAKLEILMHILRSN